MLTCEQIDRYVIGNRSRHFAFVRWVLGEPLQVAARAAAENADRPLPLDAMRHIAANWSAPDSQTGP